MKEPQGNLLLAAVAGGGVGEGGEWGATEVGPAEVAQICNSATWP